ncbi:major royal jelly protein 1-like [Sitophilus oryzae]|uniref:Major royal jelly protein 1-like n=1 Tax=Sitophilus oryzae TaxID=7048 RepID=A0A6J2XN02_SITOR|nr:major royal jelly protein 1-like [Sitophilus oryzae]
MMLKLLVVISILLATFTECLTENQVLDLTFKLSGNDLAFPCTSTKNIYANTGRWVPKNVIPTRIQIYKDQAIVALPRYRPGVPFTVGSFPLTAKPGRVALEPFPCWSIQEEGNCNAIQNAIDMVLDPLDNLWVLDLGICNTLEQPIKRCSPKVWGINAETGEVVKSINLEPFVTAESRIQYLVVDFSPEGVPFAYVSDAGSSAIIVINVQSGTGFRVILPSPIKDSAQIKDILYLQLARTTSGNVLYFSYLSSPALFSIKASSLQTGQADGAIVHAGTKPPGTQIVFLGTDNGSGLLFRYKGDSDIYIWNSNKPFIPDNFILAQRGGYCRMATQVVPGWKKLMWVIESNFHDYITSTTGCLGANVVVYPLINTE